MHEQSTKLQRRLAIICERRADCQTIAAHRLGFLIVTRAHAPFNLTHATGVFLELGFGMAIGLNDRLRSFLEIVELTQLVRDVWQDLLHRQANWALGIRHDGMDRHRQGLLDLAQQVSQILLARTVEGAGQQNLARECVAQYPEHVLGSERLQTIKRQDDVTLLREAVFQAGLVSQTQRKQLFVALQQIGDGARSDGDVQVLERLVDFGDAAMLTVAQRADVGNHIETELTMRQCPGALFLGANGLMVALTESVRAAQEGQAQAADIVEGCDGALGLVKMPQAATAGRTLLAHSLQAQRSCDRRTFRATCHSQPPTFKHLLSYASF